MTHGNREVVACGVKSTTICHVHVGCFNLVECHRSGGNTCAEGHRSSGTKTGSCGSRIGYWTRRGSCSRIGQRFAAKVGGCRIVKIIEGRHRDGLAGACRLGGRTCNRQVSGRTVGDDHLGVVCDGRTVQGSADGRGTQSVLIDFQGGNITSRTVVGSVECLCQDGRVVQDTQCRWQGRQGNGSVIRNAVVVESIPELNRDQTRFVGLHGRFVGSDQGVCQIHRGGSNIDRPDLIHKSTGELGPDGVCTCSGNPYRCSIGSVPNVVDHKWPAISCGSAVIKIDRDILTRVQKVSLCVTRSNGNKYIFSGNSGKRIDKC